MRIELIIISYNSRKHFDALIRSIESQTINNKIEITVVDNNSQDDSIQYLKENFTNVKIIQSPKNLGYGAAANLGAKNSNADIIFICNSDIILFEDTIEIAVEKIKSDPNVGVIGGQQEFPDGSWQYSYGAFSGWSRAFQNFYLHENFRAFFIRKNWKEQKYIKAKEVEYLDGAMLGIRKKVFDKVGGFDEDYFFYSEETDLCKRIKDNGLKVFFEPKMRLIHLRGGSSKNIHKMQKTSKMIVDSRLLFCKKHCGFIETKIYIFSEIYFSIFNIVFSIFQRNKSKINYHKLNIKYFFKSLF